MPRKNLQDAMRNVGQGKDPKPAPTKQEEIIPQKTNWKQANRVSKTNITGYFPHEVKASMRLVQAKTGDNMQDLLGEALNDLFAKYNVPQTAPVKETV